MTKRFLDFGQKFLGRLANTAFRVSRGLFQLKKVRNLKGECSTVFSKTSFYLEWGPFPENVLGDRSDSF